jgi:hypothetical protein
VRLSSPSGWLQASLESVFLYAYLCVLEFIIGGDIKPGHVSSCTRVLLATRIVIARMECAHKIGQIHDDVQADTILDRGKIHAPRWLYPTCLRTGQASHRCRHCLRAGCTKQAHGGTSRLSDMVEMFGGTRRGSPVYVVNVTHVEAEG